MKTLYKDKLIGSLTRDILVTLSQSETIQLESEDQMLHLILLWQENNRFHQLSQVLELVNWSLVSEEHLTYLYQNHQSIDPSLLHVVKEELIARNIINNQFDSLLKEKE